MNTTYLNFEQLINCHFVLLLPPSVSISDPDSATLFVPLSLLVPGAVFGAFSDLVGGGKANLGRCSSRSSKTTKCWRIWPLKLIPALLYAGARSLSLMRPPYSLIASAQVFLRVSFYSPGMISPRFCLYVKNRSWKKTRNISRFGVKLNSHCNGFHQIDPNFCCQRDDSEDLDRFHSIWQRVARLLHCKCLTNLSGLLFILFYANCV